MFVRLLAGEGVVWTLDSVLQRVRIAVTPPAVTGAGAFVFETVNLACMAVSQSCAKAVLLL